jgi:DNA polymerase-3 subunit alpha
MKTKVALKDIMKAIYGRSANDPEVKEICTHIPDSPQGISEKDFLYGYVDSEGVRQEGLIEQSKELQSFFSRYKDVEKMVKRLIGLVRQTGRHASGFVISTLDLAHSCVPTMIANDPILGPIQITQYDAPMCEKCGLVKADILGLNTLNVISDCLSLIKDGTKNYLAEDKNGIQQLYRLPEDQLIYKDFFDKNTDSSFQFNTSLIKTYITKFNPTERKHLSDLTALCRPGTLDAPLDISAIYRIEYDCGEIEYITEDEYNRRGLNENN